MSLASSEFLEQNSRREIIEDNKGGNGLLAITRKA